MVMDIVLNINITTITFTNTDSSKLMFIFSGIYLLFEAYILAAFVFYQVKIRGQKFYGFFQLSLEEKYRALCNFTCLVIAIIVVLRNFSPLIFFAWATANIDANITEPFRHPSIHTTCTVVKTILAVSFNIATALVYLFLWFRQRVFYIHPSLQIYNNLIIRILSGFTVGVWIIFYFPLIIVYMISVQYIFHPQLGCWIASEQSGANLKLIIITFAVVSVCMQISLLILFLYPILKQVHGKMNRIPTNSVLMRRVRKAGILTAICMITDITTVVIGFMAIEGFIISIIYSANILINQISTIFCFDDWKKIFWPWKGKENNVTLASGKNQTWQSTASTSINLNVKTPHPTQ